MDQFASVSFSNSLLLLIGCEVQMSQATLHKVACTVRCECLLPRAQVRTVLLNAHLPTLVLPLSSATHLERILVVSKLEPLRRHRHGRGLIND
jgi:hypothetical protein